jgi:hypothetical protein
MLLPPEECNSITNTRSSGKNLWQIIYFTQFNLFSTVRKKWVRIKMEILLCSSCCTFCVATQYVTRCHLISVLGTTESALHMKQASNMEKLLKG